MRDRIRALASDRKVIIGFLVIAALVFAFGKLASEILEGESFAIDRMIMLGLRDAADPAQPVGPAWLLGVMRDITAFGGVTHLTIFTVLVAVYFVVTRNPRTALFVVVAISLGATLASLAKSVVARPRPDIVPHLVEVSHSSFPSGHAMNSAIVYLTLATLVARAQPARPVRLYVQGAAIALTLLIGCSRVYLGVHWPSDVVAGWCAGALWATLCSFVFHSLLPRPHRSR
jgi:undecaprenyl-diphosphatase